MRFSAALTLCLVLSTARWGVCEDEVRLKHELPRFHAVAPGLYRGGQPTRAGFEILKEKGIKTIINLREERDEKALVEDLGFKYLYIPLDAWDRVSAQDIEIFLNAVRNSADQPVFVHCRRGADRTGLMIGIYRIAEQGWSGKQAYREAREIGLRWWYRGIKNQLHDYAENRAATAGASSGE